MTITGTILKEPIKGTEITFAVVVVKESVVTDRTLAAETARKFTSAFGGLPIVLMAQDSTGAPVYVGRPDLVWHLADVPISRIPWKQYNVK